MRRLGEGQLSSRCLGRTLTKRMRTYRKRFDYQFLLFRNRLIFLSSIHGSIWGCNNLKEFSKILKESKVERRTVGVLAIWALILGGICDAVGRGETPGGIYGAVAGRNGAFGGGFALRLGAAGRKSCGDTLGGLYGVEGREELPILVGSCGAEIPKTGSFSSSIDPSDSPK